MRDAHDLPSAPPLTGAEAVAATLLILLAAPIVGAYVCDWAGMPFRPAAMMPVALGPALAFAWWVRARVAWRADTLAAYALVVAGWFIFLLWQAPESLPIGTGPDLTHHLLLVDYIERHWRLVHDPAVERYLGEMVRYTPGVHVLAALAGAWLKSDGLHTVHGVVSAAVAMKAGFVFLIAWRVLPDVPGRVAAAALAPVLLLLPYQYVLDAFMRDSFFAQVASEGFTLGMCWALLLWAGREREDRAVALTVFAVAGAAAFLTWPIWIGPAGVALGLTVVARRPGDMAARGAMGARIVHAALAALPIAAIAAIHIQRHASGLQMAQAEGYVLHPDFTILSPWLLAPAAFGALLVATRRARPGARVVLFLLAGIALQAGVLYAQARQAGNATAYMAFKTWYLVPYPLAVLAALSAAHLLHLADARLGRERRRVVAVASGLMTALVFGGAAVRIASVDRDPPTVTTPLLQAGLWARSHLPGGCVEYLVADDEAAYWLHLAILHNERISARTGDNSTYTLTDSVLRWLSETGRPYAIADLPALPRDVREDLQILQRFDTAAVVRRDAPACRQDTSAP
ncbi:MAG: hypothetical protein AB7O93_26710 [Vicinamibacterales bacterium]